jgi:hypothetical protein
MILLSQIIINIFILVQKCGGSVSSNITSAFLMTIFPWFFIFGAVIIVLFILPGFKAPFSNVIGYYLVSREANRILNELLVNSDIDNAMKNSNLSKYQKEELQNTAETILKIFGNKSVLINEIIPDNFMNFWNLLLPLMKPEYQNGAPELQQKLFDVVSYRDNVGELIWYIYTGILIILYTQYRITTRTCNTTVQILLENQKNAEDLTLKKG